jgi:hypothetical protein
LGSESVASVRPPATDNENPSIGDPDQNGALAVRRSPEPRNCRPQFLGREEVVEQMLSFTLEIDQPPMVLPAISLLGQAGSRAHPYSFTSRPGVETTQIACRSEGVSDIGDTP